MPTSLVVKLPLPTVCLDAYGTADVTYLSNFALPEWATYDQRQKAIIIEVNDASLFGRTVNFGLTGSADELPDFQVSFKVFFNLV